jgi:hypothetical protein
VGVTHQGIVLKIEQAVVVGSVGCGVERLVEGERVCRGLTSQDNVVPCDLLGRKFMDTESMISVNSSSDKGGHLTRPRRSPSEAPPPLHSCPIESKRKGAVQQLEAAPRLDLRV